MVRFACSEGHLWYGFSGQRSQNPKLEWIAAYGLTARVDAAILELPLSPEHLKYMI